MPRWPVDQPLSVSSPYGWRVHPITGTRRHHNGCDFAKRSGAPLYAILSGRVIENFWSNEGGWTLRIQHDRDGTIATYMHMIERSPLGVNTRVADGAQVGRVGSTGTSTTGPHLHFEMRHSNWQLFDPYPYLLAITSGAPAGGGSQPLPAKPTEQEDEDDMPKNSGFYYEVTDGAGSVGVVCLIVNTGSGFYHEYGNGIGKPAIGGDYNNPVAQAFDTGSFAKITASHAGVIKAACDKVLAAGS